MAIAASVVMALITLGISRRRCRMQRQRTVRQPAYRAAPRAICVRAAHRAARLGSRPRHLAGRHGLAQSTRRASSPSNPMSWCSPAKTARIELECAGGVAPQTPQYAEYEMDLVNRQRFDAGVAFSAPGAGDRDSAVLRGAGSGRTAARRLRHDRARPFAGSRGSRRAFLAARRIDSQGLRPTTENAVEATASIELKTGY